jgi:hypothetical protein
VEVIEIVFSIPSSKHKHLSSIHQVRCMSEPCNWRSSSFWSLIPCHGHRVKSMEVSVNNVFPSFTSKYYDSRTC